MIVMNNPIKIMMCGFTQRLTNIICYWLGYFTHPPLTFHAIGPCPWSICIRTTLSNNESNIVVDVVYNGNACTYRPKLGHKYQYRGLYKAHIYVDTNDNTNDNTHGPITFPVTPNPSRDIIVLRRHGCFWVKYRGITKELILTQ